MPLVSVIIPAWNAAQFIHHPVRSALQQSLQDLEVLVVDDASSDDTRRAAEQAAEGDPRVRVLALPRNGGPSAARNAGLAAAQGDFLAMLDADDRMAPDRLERGIRLLQGTGADILLDDALRCPLADSTIGAEPHLGLPPGEQELTLAQFVRANCMGQERPLGYLKPILRRARVAAAGVEYEASLRIAEDYHLIVALMGHGARTLLTPYCGYFYWQREGSLSKRPTRRDLHAMLAADAQFQQRHAADLSPGALRALRLRRSSLEDMAAYLGCREQLLQLKLAPAVFSLLRRPAAAMRLWPLLRRSLGLVASARPVHS